jgi:nucleotide-binding universal stress UspA family protein
MMIGTILVALDGSLLAENGLNAATQLTAHAGGANLLLVRAADGAAPEAVAYLRAIVERLAQNGCHARGMVVGGNPADAILDTARREGADVIAMGTHGISGIRHLILGSVADTVLRHAAMPVLLTRATAHPSNASAHSPYRRILVPLDGSAAAETAMAFVAREGLAGKADMLLLLRAIHAGLAHFMPIGLPLSANQLRERAGLETEDALLAAREYLETVALTYLPHTIPHYSVETEYPAKAILAAVASWQIDLILMTPYTTSHGPHLHGGVTGHVLQHTQAPVLCLPNAVASSPTSDEETLAHEVQAGFTPVTRAEYAIPSTS